MIGMFAVRLYFIAILTCVSSRRVNQIKDPNQPFIVINTWAFEDAARTAHQTLGRGGNAIEAVLDGCSYCEANQCDGSVGYGNHPDEEGQTTLDAMIMDGETHGVGAVANLRNVKDAIRVAHSVMQYTKHTMLVGQQASNFALEMGFINSSLQTNSSKEAWENWKDNDCQPNFRKNVQPNPEQSCGPYEPGTEDDSREKYLKDALKFNLVEKQTQNIAVELNDVTHNHDTIGMIAIDTDGHMAAGTTTNGANHKVPGRVGDSPIPGSGSYVDSDVGGAAATGDGDVMMRFLPSFLTVELMRQGKTPDEATRIAIERIVAKYPDFSGAVIALRKDGQYGAACHNVGSGFPYAIYSEAMSDVLVKTVECVGSK